MDDKSILVKNWFTKAEHDLSVSKILISADLLTPYATAFRYPGDVMEPTRDEMNEGFKRAEDLVAFTMSLLPDELPKELKNA